MIVALAVAANWTSFSVTPPTPRCTNDSLTSARSSLRRLSVSASSEPVTSALRMRFSVAASPGLDLLEDVLELGATGSSREPRGRGGDPLPVLAGGRHLGRPPSHSGAITNGRRPVGHLGQAEDLDRRRRAGFLDLLTVSLMRARTRPHAAPATIGSPTRSVPCCTSTVATGPRPMSRLDSSTTPRHVRRERRGDPRGRRG
jgi:hypothetical protein